MSAAETLKNQSLFKGIAYGPLQLAPFGNVVGVNVLGDGMKVCSFDCPYCDLGPTELRLNRLKNDVSFPTPEEVRVALTDALGKIHREGPAIDGLMISGNGEPTLHPDFPDVVKAILAARDAWYPGKPVSVHTNGANLDTRKIYEALNLLEARVVKIDAGNEKTFKHISAPLSRTNLARVLAGSRKLKDVIVQSMFVKGAADNTQTPDIDDWLEVIAILKPKAVHIQGMSRPSLANPGLIRCDEDTLYAIASRLERKTSIKAVVLP